MIEKQMEAKVATGAQKKRRTMNTLRGCRPKRKTKTKMGKKSRQEASSDGPRNDVYREDIMDNKKDEKA